VKHLGIYVRALGTYIVVDVAYQAAIGFHLMTHFVTNSPLKDVYVEPTPVGALLMLLFFALIAFANFKLAIEPAIEAESVRHAATQGAILGTAAYATLGLTNGWSLDGFPLLFSLNITLEGALFSAVTSGLTTWWVLRRASKA
jgi:uncharacterized membrane protein